MIELVIASLIVSIAYVYAPILRVHAAKSLRLQMPPGTVANGADAVPLQLEALPEKIEKMIALESEAWARDAGRQRARQLYSELEDWDEVFVQMEKES